MRPGSKVYATRIAFAIMAGILSAIINPLTFKLDSHGVIASVIPIFTAAFLYIASYYFVKSVVKVQPSSLNDPTYMYKGGIFTYIIVWFVTWSLTATIFYWYMGKCL
jgi:uncharacterized membrane protein YdcZ (DUF606 family)